MAYTYKILIDAVAVNEQDTSEIIRWKSTHSDTTHQCSMTSFALSGTTQCDINVSQFTTLTYILLKAGDDCTSNVAYHYTSSELNEEIVSLAAGDVALLPGTMFDEPSGATSYATMAAAQTGTLEVFMVGVT